MRLTNKLGLPQPIVDAVANDPYSRGGADISVTGLLKPARASALELLHSDEIEEDASDRIWSLLGQATHVVAERANTTGVAERRLSTKVEGWTVSGSMDLFYPKTGVLYDLKVTSIYKLKDENLPLDFVAQLNMYAELLRRNGDKVKELYIIGILRDWSKLEALRNRDLPQSQVVLRKAPLWPAKEAAKFMRERVVLHQQARVVLPECTPLERWARNDTFAVMKTGGKRAVRVFNSPEMALEMSAMKPGHTVVKRPGENIRCKAYCSVSKFCSQWRELNPEGEALAEEEAI